MRRPVKFCLPAALVVFSAAVASAQPCPQAGPVSRPSLSPYLNLVNRGNNPALNYFGIVRPQQQAQQRNQLSQQYTQTTNALQNSVNSLAEGADPNVRFTRNVAVFNNTGPYFSRNPISGSNGGGGGSGGFNTTNRGSGGVSAPRGGSSPVRR
jgi:hypothetical protein